MAYTEFFCQSGGSNLNAGSTNTNAATFTYTGGSWNGTSLFTVGSGNPLSDGVTTSMFASLYITSGAVTTGYIGLITAVSSTTVTISTSAKSGSAPVANGAGAFTLKVGGAWAGPSGSTAFPFGFIGPGCTDTAGDSVRVNLKGGSNYAITAAMSQSANGGPITFQGYTSSPGDGGKAVIDGGTSGTAYVLLTLSTTNIALRDLIFQNNGATAAANLVSVTSQRCMVDRCVFAHSRGNGGVSTVSNNVWAECEAYDANQSNTASLGGFNDVGGSCTYVRCYSHDNTGSNTAGFMMPNGSVSCIDCISANNGGSGYAFSGSLGINVTNCTAYANTGSGVKLTAGGCSISVENCILVSNGAYGIDVNQATLNTRLLNNGFYNNTSGQVNQGAAQNQEQGGSITLGGNPFVNPAAGNFALLPGITSVRGGGRGTFTATATGLTAPSNYPDLGAVQHRDATKVRHRIGVRS